MLRRLFALLVLLSFSLAPTAAASGWTSPALVDSGWVQTNPRPWEQEPQVWSDPMAVPLPPEGATLVRVTRLAVEYAYDYTVTNVSPEYVSWRGTGTYQMMLGHAPGLSVWGGEVHLAGCDDSNLAAMARIASVSAGNGGYYEYLPPGATREGWDAIGWYTPMVHSVEPVWGWWQRTRDGATHSLYMTPSIQWDSHTWSWVDGTAPPGWNSGHNPCSSSMEVWSHLVCTVEFYVP